MKVSQIACGRAHNIAIASNRESENQKAKLLGTKSENSIENFVFSWGCGADARLGFSDNLDKLIPTKIEGLTNENAKQISCGFIHTFVLSNNGNLYSFGNNEYGQLGIGHNKPSKEINKLTNYKFEKVQCGGFHSMAITYTKKVYSWGIIGRAHV